MAVMWRRGCRRGPRVGGASEVEPRHELGKVCSMELKYAELCTESSFDLRQSGNEGLMAGGGRGCGLERPAALTRKTKNLSFLSKYRFLKTLCSRGVSETRAPSLTSAAQYRV